MKYKKRRLQRLHLTTALGGASPRGEAFASYRRREKLYTCFGTPEPAFLCRLPFMLSIEDFLLSDVFLQRPVRERGQHSCLQHRGWHWRGVKRVFASFCRARQKEVPARHERNLIRAIPHKRNCGGGTLYCDQHILRAAPPLKGKPTPARGLQKPSPLEGGTLRTASLVARRSRDG